MPPAKLYLIENGALQSLTPALDLGALTDALADTGAFELPLPESAVLKRQQKANVFALVHYTLD